MNISTSPVALISPFPSIVMSIVKFSPTLISGTVINTLDGYLLTLNEPSPSAFM